MAAKLVSTLLILVAISTKLKPSSSSALIERLDSGQKDDSEGEEEEAPAGRGLRQPRGWQLDKMERRINPLLLPLRLLAAIVRLLLLPLRILLAPLLILLRALLQLLRLLLRLLNPIFLLLLALQGANLVLQVARIILMIVARILRILRRRHEKEEQRETEVITVDEGERLQAPAKVPMKATCRRPAQHHPGDGSDRRRADWGLGLEREAAKWGALVDRLLEEHRSVRANLCAGAGRQVARLALDPMRLPLAQQVGLLCGGPFDSL